MPIECPDGFGSCGGGGYGGGSTGGYGGDGSGMFFNVGGQPYYFGGYNGGNNPIGSGPTLTPITPPPVVVNAALPLCSNVRNATPGFQCIAADGSVYTVPNNTLGGPLLTQNILQTAQNAAANAQANDDAAGDEGFEIDNNVLLIGGAALLGILLLK